MKFIAKIYNPVLQKRLILLVCFSMIFVPISAQPGQEISLAGSDSSLAGLNRLTIYVIPSRVKYNWSSPHALYRSYIKNARKNLFSKTNYNLGHAFLDLQTNDPDERIFTGMRSSSSREGKNLVLKEKYGLAILGCGMSGRLESEEELSFKLKKLSRKGQLAFLEFIISNEATERLQEFYISFKAQADSCPSGMQYGGAYWPRYKGEGAGCSAFVISFMDIAGLMKNEFEEWLIKIDIPMSLIGGPYNKENEVRLKDIRKAKSWANTCDSAANTYEHLEIYDPTLMFEWIHAEIEKGQMLQEVSITPVQSEKAVGLRIDSRNQPLPALKDLFTDRDKPSIFVNCPE
jgi:hypothetical protein